MSEEPENPDKLRDVNPEQKENWYDNDKKYTPLLTPLDNRVNLAQGCFSGFFLILLSAILSKIATSSMPFWIISALSFGFLLSPKTRMLFAGYLIAIALMSLLYLVIMIFGAGCYRFGA